MSQKSIIITCHWSVTSSHSIFETKTFIATSVESSVWQILWLVKLLLLVRLRLGELRLSILRLSILQLSILRLLLIILHVGVLRLLRRKQWLLLHERWLLLRLWSFRQSMFFPFHEICIHHSFLEKVAYPTVLLLMANWSTKVANRFVDFDTTV